MSQIDRLISNYQTFVRLPWQSNLAGRQRVWFAVYPPSEERRLRARIQEFEVVTQEVKHRWRIIDITDSPSRWLGSHEYKESYFSEPAALVTIEDDLKKEIVRNLKDACMASGVDKETVLAVLGVGSLFGVTYLSGVIAEVEESIPGRLLVFFPGEYERNVYRFMDARDGFNYMAVPITCSERLAI